MSKNMWIDAEDCKPVHENEKTSVGVLIWVEGWDIPKWARWNFIHSLWVVESIGSITPNRIKYFAYIDNPYK